MTDTAVAVLPPPLDPMNIISSAIELLLVSVVSPFSLSRDASARFEYLRNHGIVPPLGLSARSVLLAIYMYV